MKKVNLDWKEFAGETIIKRPLAVLDEINTGTLGLIFQVLTERGLLFLIVGGAVRDALLGFPSKDIDIEVYGISYEALEALLGTFGRVDVVGRAFGTIKFRDPDTGKDMDFAIPRRESRLGAHHRDFKTEFDHRITPKEAAARRDFTINAMGYNPLTQELHDYFGGLQDMERKLLEATGPAFEEDALRVLRGMQFSCRFGFQVGNGMVRLAQQMRPDYEHLSKERIAEEWMKWATKSVQPGRALPYLSYTQWIGLYPELCGIFAIPQDSEWHPEGEVDTHTAFVCNAAALIADREGLTGDARAVLLFAALCHDFGKATHTVKKEVRGKLRWASPGHEAASGPLARAFLESIGIKQEIIDQVVPLVEDHMVHVAFEKHAHSRTVRRLAKRLFPASIQMLALLVEADVSGRPPLPAHIPDSVTKMLALAEENQVVHEPQKPLIQGRDVMPYFDSRPGPHIGVVCKAAMEAQEEGLISTPEQAQKWLVEHMQTLRKEEEI